MKSIRFLMALAAFGPALGGVPAGAGGLGGPSPYTEAIAAAAANWPPAELGELKRALEPDKEQVALLCFVTHGDDLYLGLAQYQVIAAPFDRAVAALDDIPGYVGIFDGLLVSRVEQKEEGRLSVFSEQRIGVPLARNEKDEIIYWISEQAAPRRKVYRYQLKSSNHLRSDDGLIVVEAAGSGKTEYTEYDFYDADWGLARALGRDRIWKENIRGLAQTTLAIRLKAEHPDWSPAQILKTSLARAKAVKAAACISSGRPLPAAAAAVK